MATIRQYDNGRWQAVVRRKGHLPVSKAFASRAEAYGWARLLESEIDRGMFADRTEAERSTIGDLIDRYAQEVTPQKKSARRETVRLRLLKARLGKLSPANLQSRHVSCFRDERLGTDGVAGATVLKEMNTLSHVIDTAIRDWGLPLHVNPVRLVRRPPTSRGRDRRLERGEEEKLAVACRTSGAPLLYPMLVLALETAMRLGELLSLDWRNVDLAARVATLPDTKNGEVRRVPLSTRAVEALRTIPRNLSDSRVFWRWNRADSFENAWRRTVLKTGIENLRFHDLRHEATSRLFEKGFNMMEVASITGHKTLQMLKRYTHLRAENLVARLA